MWTWAAIIYIFGAHCKYCYVFQSEEEDLENIETKEDEQDIRDIIVELPIFAWIFIGICSVLGLYWVMFLGGAWLGILDVPIFRHILDMIALILISIYISFGIICLVFFVYVQLSQMLEIRPRISLVY